MSKVELVPSTLTPSPAPSLTDATTPDSQTHKLYHCLNSQLEAILRFRLRNRPIYNKDEVLTSYDGHSEFPVEPVPGPLDQAAFQRSDAQSGVLSTQLQSQFQEAPTL